MGLCRLVKFPNNQFFSYAEQMGQHSTTCQPNGGTQPQEPALDGYSLHSQANNK